MPLLEPGAMAPDFELPDSTGAPVRLSALRGRPVVVYFYPKDDTTVCTKQACTFRDRFAEFESSGARILGISDDSAASHTKFAAKYALPFTLLSDKGGGVRKLYGVNKKFGLIPGRATYVIDPAGKIRHVYSALSESGQHVEEALRALTRS
ncbi:MAG TPA: peroxiredoxin [Bryobacteraceae bacterium]|nr:peroxiredoxin [Bryobacteraceae bacterium]